MKPKKTTCAKCDAPGFTFRGERWLCTIHNRFDTMINCARLKGKVIPSFDQLAAMTEELVADGMKCSHCREVMVWNGPPRPQTVSLQHDRSGRIRFLCCRCNTRHDDFPGDTFYDYPAGWKMCKACDTPQPRDNFYPNTAGNNAKLQGYCKPCQSEFFKKRRRAAKCES